MQSGFALVTQIRAGWGYLHALINHNLNDYSMIDLVADNKFGYVQSNGRYLYGVYFVDPNNHKITQYAQLSEDREKGYYSPDNKEAGEITAYCLDSIHVVENMCPAWVNGSL